METISLLEGKKATNTVTNTVNDIQIFQFPSDHSLRSYAIETLLNQGCVDFYNYVQWTGLGKEKGLMVLMPVSHYYYDIDDLKGVRILICQKNLNFITHIDSFLNTMFRALPANSYFLGYFRCNDITRDQTLNGSRRKFENIFMNRLSCSHNEILINKKGVFTMLEGHGFKVIDLTDFNGNTYFCSRIIKRTGG